MIDQLAARITATVAALYPGPLHTDSDRVVCLTYRAKAVSGERWAATCSTWGAVAPTPDAALRALLGHVADHARASLEALDEQRDRMRAAFADIARGAEE